MGEDCCGGRCTKTSFDAANCGECGKQCPAGQRCCKRTCIPANQRCGKEVLGILIRDRQRYTSSRHGLSYDVAFSAVLVPDPKSPGDYTGHGTWGGQVKTVLINPGQCSKSTMHEVGGAIQRATGGVAGNRLTYYLYGGQYETGEFILGIPIADAGMLAQRFLPGTNSLTVEEDKPTWDRNDCWGTVAYKRWARIQFVWVDPDNPPAPPPIPKLPQPPASPPVIPGPPLL
ncbi:MAG: Stigma-specific protein Stig1 [Thermomicrobiales bacterium]|nr:Stigma-specific protein Stig1 [Thermomicrobiales bacterium]